jgi:hypothetical protein
MLPASVVSAVPQGHEAHVLTVPALPVASRHLVSQGVSHDLPADKRIVFCLVPVSCKLLGWLFKVASCIIHVPHDLFASLGLEIQ